MKRTVIISAALLFAACLTAYVCGRVMQHSELRRIASIPSPNSAASPADLPVDFGQRVHDDITRLSFADLYETLRNANPQLRTEWLEQLEQTSESPRKVAALCAYFRALVQADPQTAADLVINLPRHRGPAMDAMILAAPPSAMPVLAEMLLKVPSAARNFGLTDHVAVVIDEWTLVDPNGAAQFIDQHESSQDFHFQEYADALLRTWAGIDHESAWKWLESHSDDLFEMHIESWLNGWFEADQNGAMKFALEHLDNGKFAEASTSFAPQLFQRDPNIAKTFIERLPAGELRKQALNGIASEAGSPDYSEGYQPDVVSKFIVKFPLDEWPKDFSDVLNRWRFRDSPGLLGWISRLPAAEQDKVVENFPEPISYELEQEFLPVLQLPSSDLRMKLLRRMVNGLQTEGEPAREVIEKLKLSSQQKAELRTLVQKNNS